MAHLALLERVSRAEQDALKERVITPAEAEHQKNIAENFRRLRMDEVESLKIEEETESVPSYASARIAQYTAVPAPSAKRQLFADLVFKDGYIQSTAPVVEQPAAPAAPAMQEAALAPVSIEDEDALPTPRTMDTLRHPAVQAQGESRPAAKTGVFAALSTKAKIALVTVMVAIIVAIAVICINTGLIGSLNAGIAAKEARLAELKEASQSIEDRIADYLDPDYVAEWAEEHGMVYSPEAN